MRHNCFGLPFLSVLSQLFIKRNHNTCFKLTCLEAVFGFPVKTKNKAYIKLTVIMCCQTWYRRSVAPFSPKTMFHQKPYVHQQQSLKKNDFTKKHVFARKNVFTRNKNFTNNNGFTIKHVSTKKHVSTNDPCFYH